MKNRVILLAEDDENDVLLIKRAFKKSGLANPLKVVNDGAECIAYLAGQGDYFNRIVYPQPYLLLLDLKMPMVDGFGVLRWARASADWRRLLIVVLSSSEFQNDVDRAYELGANSYLLKPVGFEEMVHLVQRFEAYWNEINRLPSDPTGSRPVAPHPASNI